MRARWLLVAAAALAVVGAPAAAQFSDSYSFLKAVKDRNGDDASKIAEKPSFTDFDVRDQDTGETALHIVTKRRDGTWLRYLIYKGASVNVRDRDGATPLLDAATIGWADGASVLIKAGARVDQSNNNGETPLMRAVQAHDADTVRVLLNGGANPNLKDHMTGKTARDYAMVGHTDPAILDLLKNAKTPTATMGPHL